MKKVILVLLFLITTIGCDSKPSQQAAPVQTLSIKGSDTMVHLVSSWTEEFMKTHAEADISVTGGGSGSMGAQAATEAMRMRRRLMRMAIAVESPVAAPS